MLILSIFSKKIRGGIKEKFGFYDFDFSSQNKTLWIHAISVGEVQAITNLIKNLQGFEIVLTTSTPQGQELAQKQLSDYCKKITYFPYDFSFSVRSAIKRINPKAVLIVETEIWPNFSKIVKENNIPLVILNGRISERTYKSYKKLSFFFKEVLSNYYRILAQSEDDKARFINIGSPKDKVEVMGNIKFDIEMPNTPNFNLELGTCPLIIAGSTHRGEDEIIIETYKNLKEKYQNLKLLIAPRHLERVSQIQSLCKCALKSKETFKDNDILILDTTGELKYVYYYAKVVFIGGSFNKTGGHNPLEATIWGKPVISGPNIKNFKLIYKNLCELNCAKIAKNQTELQNEFDKLLSDNKYYLETEKNCELVFEKNRGAMKYLTDFIYKELKNDN